MRLVAYHLLYIYNKDFRFQLLYLNSLIAIFRLTDGKHLKYRVLSYK